MEFYLLFCISLNLAYRGIARNIDMLNMKSTLNSTSDLSISSTESTSNATAELFMFGMESTLNSTEDLFMSSTESALNSTEDLFMSSTESALNSTEDLFMSSTESALNSTEDLFMSSTESALNSTEDLFMSSTESASNSTEDLFVSSTERTLNSTEDLLMSSTESALNSTEDLLMSSTDRIFNFRENTTTMTMTHPNCPENMIAVGTNPADDSWICICYPPFVRLMENLCSELFRQGPCEPGNFLVRPRYHSPNSETIRCLPNPCLEDGLVPDNGTCSNITTIPLCNGGRLFYIEATMKIECKYTHTYNLFSWPMVRGCPPGTRKDKNGVCRQKL